MFYNNVNLLNCKLIIKVNVDTNLYYSEVIKQNCYRMDVNIYSVHFSTLFFFSKMDGILMEVKPRVFSFNYVLHLLPTNAFLPNLLLNAGSGSDDNHN